MKIESKKLIIFLAIFVGLQVILFVTLNIFSSSNIKLYSMNRPLLKNVTSKNIISLEIVDAEKSFKLEKNADSWIVNYRDSKVPANISKVEGYLKIIESLKKGMVIESNLTPESKKRYGFDDLVGQKVVVFTMDKKTIEIRIGNVGPTKGTSYIIINNGFTNKSDVNSVREVKSLIAVETPNDVLKWTDQSIIKGIDLDSVKTISYSLKSSKYNVDYSISSKDDPAQPGKKIYEIVPSIEKELKEFALENQIKSIISFKADNFKYDGKVDGLKNLGFIKIVLNNGDTRNINVYNSDDQSYDFVFKPDYNSYVYFVTQASIERVVKNPSEFIKN